MKKFLKKYIWVAFILIGLVIIIYPKVKERYNDHQQEQMIATWEGSLTRIESETEATSVATIEDGQLKVVEVSDRDYMISLIEDIFRADQAFDNLHQRDGVAEEGASIPFNEGQRDDSWLNDLEHGAMEGILIIENIELEMPILKGATAENLDLSVSSIDMTGRPWSDGNYAIAGHRSHTYGRNFNRLGEMAIGDRIEIIGLDDKRYIYEVNEKFIVDESEVWVLSDREDVKQITLVTCDPLYVKSPPTRLIIKGEMIEIIEP